MALRFAPARGASVLISSSSRGPTGSAATLTAGTSTTLAAGNSATATNSGTTAAAIFDLGIPRGADAGIKWLYDSSTSMADPGSGDIRFNNATLSSVTAIAVSNTGSGVDVSDYVATWDDSTNTTKGHIMIREEAAGVAALFSVSAVTDNSDWLQLTVVYVSGSLALTAADPLYVVPLLIGNKGADGSGTFPGSSQDNAAVRFDGTAGTTVQDSNLIIEDTGVTRPSTAATVATLGSSSNPWSGLYLGNAGEVNFNNGDVTITHSTNALSFAGSTGYSFDSKVIALDTIELGNASDTTLSRTGAGAIAVEGVTVTLNTTAQTHTAASLELGHASDTTLTRSGAGAIAVEGVEVALNSTAVSHTANTYEVGNASDTTLSRVSAGVLGVEGKSVATLSSTQNWTAQQYFGLSTLTDGASITWDVSNGQKAKVTLNGNRTMLAVTGPVEGATYSLWSIQDSTGSRTITWTSTGAGSFDFGADGAPTLSTTGSKADLLCFESLSYGSVLKLRFAGIKKGFT